MTPEQFILLYVCSGIFFFLMGCRPNSYLHKCRDWAEENRKYNYINTTGYIKNSPLEDIGFADRKKDIVFISFLISLFWPLRIIYLILKVIYLILIYIVPIFNLLALILVGDKK